MRSRRLHGSGLFLKPHALQIDMRRRAGGLWQCELYERLHNQEDPEGDDDHLSCDSQGPGEWWTPSSGTVSCDQDPTHHEDDCQCGGNRSSRYAGDR